MTTAQAAIDWKARARALTMRTRPFIGGRFDESAGAREFDCISPIDELRVGNIVARNLKIVTSPGLGGIDVIGMNFLSQLRGWRVEERTLILVPHNPQPTGAG